MLALGTDDIPLVLLLGLAPLAVYIATGESVLRAAARRKLRAMAGQLEELTQQLEAQDSRNRQTLELVEQLQRSLRASQEEVAKLARELEAVRRTPAETRDTTPFPAGNGVASPVSTFLIFPEIMRQAPLDGWVKRIEDAVRSREPAAGLLAAELHVVAACENGEPDSRILLGALKEVSRCLVGFLSSAGQAPSRVVEELTVWAEQFNSVARGRYSIQVPRLGGSMDLSYASPRPGVKTVSQVLTWAVRNANGMAEFKAEVA